MLRAWTAFNACWRWSETHRLSVYMRIWISFSFNFLHFHVLHAQRHVSVPTIYVHFHVRSFVYLIALKLTELAHGYPGRSCATKCHRLEIEKKIFIFSQLADDVQHLLYTWCILCFMRSFLFTHMYEQAYVNCPVFTCHISDNVPFSKQALGTWVTNSIPFYGFSLITLIPCICMRSVTIIISLVFFLLTFEENNEFNSD